MEKNAFITVNGTQVKELGVENLKKRFVDWISEPVKLLGEYYSSVLEKQLSVKQTLSLVEVQLAFIAGILPADISITLRILFIGWFISAALRCRKCGI